MTCETFVIHDGDVDSGTFITRLNEGFAEYHQLMDNLNPWYPEQQILTEDITVEEVAPENRPDGVIESNQAQKQGMRAAPFIGAAAGILTVLLGLILFARRRNRYDIEQVSHLKLDEDEDTFYNESDDGDAKPIKHQYNTRDTHIVGEGDSVISNWTGYTGANAKSSPEKYELAYRDGLMRGHSSDVHHCASATCDICEEQRQNGVTFIKTGATSLNRSYTLPSDASREYIAEDTVEL